MLYFSKKDKEEMSFKNDDYEKYYKPDNIPIGKSYFEDCHHAECRMNMN